MCGGGRASHIDQGPRCRFPAHVFFFFAMATRVKRTKFTAEEVLVQMVNENEFDSDHGGVSSGKESDIYRQLMDFVEE